MSGVVGGAGGKASQNLGYFYLPERPKKKELLKGVKYYSYLDGRRKL